MAVTNEEVFNWLQANPQATDAEIAQAAAAAGVSAQQLSQVTGIPVAQVIARVATAVPNLQLPSAPAPTPAAAPVKDWNYDEYLQTIKQGGDLNEQAQRLAKQAPVMAANASNVFNEIVAQQQAGTSEFWYKGNTASKESAAADFALRLAENGIGSLKELGQSTVSSGFDENGMPIEQQVTINKATGEPLPRPELLGRGTRGLDIDYNLAFAADGTVIPYTSNRESSWMSFREDTLKPAAAFALNFVGAPLVGAAVAPGLAAATQGAIGGALTGAAGAALTDSNILKGALLGGVGGYLQGANAVPDVTDASFIADDAAQLAAQGLSESAIKQVLSAPGYVSDSAASLAASMAVNGVDAAMMAQQLTALSSNTGLMSQTFSDATFIADDAAQLAAQGLSESAIKQVLSAPGYVSDSAASLAASMAANGLDAVTMAQQLDALSSNTGLMSQTGSDASFIANDAAQLAEQGLSQEAIKQVLAAPGYVSDSAAELAASMASNGLDTTTIAQQLDALSNNTGLMSQTGSSADFLASDALQLQGQVGNNVAAIEQNLIASGVDPLVAADVANQVVLKPSITQPELATNISNNFGNSIYDVDMAATYPTSTLPGSGGLLSDLPVTAPAFTAPAVAPVAPTPVAPTPMAPAPAAAPVATTPVAPSAPAAAPSIAPVAGAATSGLLSSLTPAQIANLLKAGISLAGISAGAGAIGNQGSSFTPFQAPTQQMPAYTPEYYNQLQQYYNAYLPQAPKDVVAPLQQWYNSSYGA